MASQVGQSWRIHLLIQELQEMGSVTGSVLYISIIYLTFETWSSWKQEVSKKTGILLPATSQVPTMTSFMWNDSIIQNMLKQQLNIISCIIQQQINNEAGQHGEKCIWSYIIDKCEDKHKFWANCQLGLNIF